MGFQRHAHAKVAWNGPGRFQKAVGLLRYLRGGPLARARMVVLGDEAPYRPAKRFGIGARLNVFDELQRAFAFMEHHHRVRGTVVLVEASVRIVMLDDSAKPMAPIREQTLLAEYFASHQRDARAHDGDAWLEDASGARFVMTLACDTSH